MKRIWPALLLLAAFAAAAGPAAAQVIQEPQPFEEEPTLAWDAYGFFTVALGICYPPTFTLNTRPLGGGQYYQSFNKTVSFPGVAAQLSLIPVWADNGLDIEVGYDLQSLHWQQHAAINGISSSGRSTLGLNMINFSANYVRYFLPNADRIYLLGGFGYSWNVGNLQASTGGNGITSSGSFANWRANAGFGYVHLWKAEVVGFEVRADFPLLTDKIHLLDSTGPFDMYLKESPVLRLMATFGLGRMKNN